MGLLWSAGVYWVLLRVRVRVRVRVRGLLGSGAVC